MKTLKLFLGIGVVIVAACIVFGGLLAVPVTAQLRAAFVKDLNNAAYQPFAGGNQIKQFAANTVEVTADLLDVPAGKRAVIEHLSCIDFLSATNNFVRMELRYSLGGVARAHQFVHTNAGQSFAAGVDVLTFSQPLRTYADPSTTISVFALRRSISGIGGIECQISGYYVDATP